MVSDPEGLTPRGMQLRLTGEPHMRLLAIKLTILFSFCGGPLFIADLLKLTLGEVGAFAAAMAPVAIAGFCAFSLWDHDPWTKVAILAGLLAIAALALMNVLTIWQLATGPGHPNRDLIIVGIATGTAGSVAYALLAYRRLRV